MAVGAVGVAGVVTARRAAGFRARARKAALRMALQRARAAQVAVWIEQFGIPNCGRLERDELAELLQHLKPEMGVPSAHVLDQLLIHATEVKTYSLYLRGDPNGSVCAELIMPTVSAYTTYCAVASAFDRRAGKGGMVALHELPALLREANHGVVPCETREFDYVMDCCSALLPGGLPLESTSVLSRQDVLLPFLAREIKFGKRVHVQDLLDDNASDDTISIKSDDDYGSIDDVEEDEEEPLQRPAVAPATFEDVAPAGSTASSVSVAGGPAATEASDLGGRGVTMGARTGAMSAPPYQVGSAVFRPVSTVARAASP